MQTLWAYPVTAEKNLGQTITRWRLLQSKKKKESFQFVITIAALQPRSAMLVKCTTNQTCC